MRLSRRDVLVGSAGLAALALAAPAHATRAPMPPVTLVLGGGHSDPDFLAGARASARALGLAVPGQLLLTRDLAADFKVVRQWAVSAGSGQIVGLLDDSMAFIVEEALRDANAGILCSGTHVILAGGGSRHRMISAPAAQGIGSDLAEGLAFHGVGASIRESAMDCRWDDWSCRTTAPDGARPGPVAYLLGKMLFQLAVGTRPMGAMSLPEAAPLAWAGPPAQSASLVSLVARI